ncbi:hypothetical protein DCE79_05365 [Lysinibacillus sp. 2017]|uniref:alpha/beta hydrolase n=1 Tax=unclassified Lysinibacillus TaxID=2636778 RepID=UPI000D5272CD|nr:MULTISPECIES: alpha/beta hydrolase [unclassified Lysinibacillus]AWE06861.1 hypothetical protein DCE79_05365 [Lysinibacillus sp. 2017]TGN37208.1 alpha/beta hydrolase [Lysinibacillus sp. S2017]
MKKKYVLASGLATTAIATAVTGYLVTNRIMYIKKKDDEFIYEREQQANRFDEVWYESCPKELLTITSPNGYAVKGVFLKPLETTNTVIICHGVTENKINSMKYARMFEHLGFNAIVYDHRRHGESEGKTTSYGHYEKLDLQAMVQAVREKIGEDALLGIHGESMGAATTILYAGTLENRANFYVSDCAFSNFPELLQIIFKDSLPVSPKYSISFANLFLKLRDGYSLSEVDPLKAVTNIEQPVLFIHSEPDTFIPADMSRKLYEAKLGDKMLKLFEKGEHAKSFNESPLEYEQAVAKFLHDYVPQYHNENTRPLTETIE